MSAIEYTKCDGKDCGAVTPDNPCEVAWDAFLGWGSLTVAGVSYDLCPECAKKAMDAVGVSKKVWEARRANDAD